MRQILKINLQTKNKDSHFFVFQKFVLELKHILKKMFLQHVFAREDHVDLNV